MLLWGGIGLAILLLGLAAALYYMNRERLPSDSRLRVVQDFMERGRAQVEDTLRRAREAARSEEPPPPPPPEARERGAMRSESPGGVRSYTVQPGETLWHIAATGRLVDSPYEWRTILAQNMDKVDYAFVSRENGGWKVVMTPGQTLTVRPGAPYRPQGLTSGRYALQLASLPASARGRGTFVVRVLLRDGYFAYLYPATVDGGTVYRVRSGFYESEARATAVGKEIQERYAERNWFPDKPWVMEAPDAERRGDDLVFGIQRTDPWVVEVGEYRLHGEALAQLRRIKDVGDFSYIAQTHDPLTRRYRYHTRVGFFPGEDAAADWLKNRQGEAWADAKVVQVNYFQEALPGQHMRLGGGGS